MKWLPKKCRYNENILTIASGDYPKEFFSMKSLQTKGNTALIKAIIKLIRDGAGSNYRFKSFKHIFNIGKLRNSFKVPIKLYTIINIHIRLEEAWHQTIIHNPLSVEDDPIHGENEAHALIKGKKTNGVVNALKLNSTWQNYQQLGLR